VLWNWLDGKTNDLSKGYKDYLSMLVTQFAILDIILDSFCPIFPNGQTHLPGGISSCVKSPNISTDYAPLLKVGFQIISPLLMLNVCS